MAQIISHSHHTEQTEYSLEYTYKNNHHAGFSFPCDKDGNPVGLRPEGKANYEKCFSGEYEVDFMGIETRERDIFHPTVVKCECGETHHLYYEVDCDCGRCYNVFGQELATLEYADDDQDGDFYADDRF